jgi:hypothetical protein
MFGEYVTAIRLENMIKEIVLKASLYNWFRSMVIPHNLEQKLDSYCYNIMLDSCVRLVLLDSLEV